MRSERADEATAVLRLLDAPSMGPRRVLQLLLRHVSARAAEDALTSSSSTPPAVRTFLKETPRDEYEDSIRRTEELGGGFWLWCDEDYPANLTTWEGRPPVLFYRGTARDLRRRALALVGRVDPTQAGTEAAVRFARKCVEYDIQVISGLAKGIDGASHRGALSEPAGETVAVLGHGIDHAYPRENADLYAAIPHHGILVSQFKTGTGPQKWTFPARNEVMCTLALGTVIIEGKPKCGSLIQADFSFKHHRPVFVLARNLRSEDSGWARQLAGRGAHVVERFDQVLEVLDGAADEVPAFHPTLFEGDGVKTSRPGEVAGLFDLDGVVVDTREATAIALARIASRHLGRPVEPSAVTVTGRPHMALANLGVRSAYDVYREEYDREFFGARGDIAVFGPVVEGLRGLRDSGVRLAAITAQPRRRADVMLPEDVRQLFDVMLCYNDTRGRKEVGIAEALRCLSMPLDRSFFVGDQPSDLEAARKAGVKAVGVLWGFSSEDDLRRWPHDVLLAEPRQIDVDLLNLLF